ncbi:unnamed protein product [Moneuplotes crassus]|uniref:Uncharacterized protein n=1 Tax=Euplotes crassus TaxID=5936 RepID=A0AAD1XNZ7_EUPCR|nr:unnamed protein product [Moneuplotes crassus]
MENNHQSSELSLKEEGDIFDREILLSLKGFEEAPRYLNLWDMKCCVKKSGLPVIYNSRKSYCFRPVDPKEELYIASKTIKIKDLRQSTSIHGLNVSGRHLMSSKKGRFNIYAINMRNSSIPTSYKTSSIIGLMQLTQSSLILNEFVISKRWHKRVLFCGSHIQDIQFSNCHMGTEDIYLPKKEFTTAAICYLSCSSGEGKQQEYSTLGILEMIAGCGLRDSLKTVSFNTSNSIVPRRKNFGRNPALEAEMKQAVMALKPPLYDIKFQGAYKNPLSIQYSFTISLNPAASQKPTSKSKCLLQ